MRFVDYLILTESSLGDLKTLADDIIEQLAGEGIHDHDTIIRVARNRLANEFEYQDDPDKVEGAIKLISQYVSGGVQ